MHIHFGITYAYTSRLSLIINRDNIYSINKGNFMQYTAGFMHKAFGSTHSFNEFILDLRKDFPFNNKSVLAVQF